MQIIWTATVILLFPVAAFYMLVANRVISRIESQHPATHAKLGNISLVLNNTVSNSHKFILFLVRSEYRSLGDRELTEAATVARNLLLFGILLTVAAFGMPIVMGYM